MIINKGNELTDPIISAKLELEEEVSIQLEEIQFTQIQDFVEKLSMYNAVSKVTCHVTVLYLEQVLNAL